MIIIATFANRTYDSDIIELVCAWDEYAVESNYEGWKADRQKALDSWGEDLLRHVTVDIEVPMKEIQQALDPQITVKGVVTVDEEES